MAPNFYSVFVSPLQAMRLCPVDRPAPRPLQARKARRALRATGPRGRAGRRRPGHL